MVIHLSVLLYNEIRFASMEQIFIMLNICDNDISPFILGAPRVPS